MRTIPSHYIYVLMLPKMCPHTTKYVSSYYHYKRNWCGRRRPWHIASSKAYADVCWRMLTRADACCGTLHLRTPSLCIHVLILLIPLYTCHHTAKNVSSYYFFPFNCRRSWCGRWRLTASSKHFRLRHGSWRRRCLGAGLVYIDRFKSQV